MTRFEWDEEKSARNLKERGFGFSFAGRIWSDPFLFVEKNAFAEGEQRWDAIGRIAGSVLLMVHTIRVFEENEAEEVIRIISAREATKHEVKRYSDGE